MKLPSGYSLCCWINLYVAVVQGWILPWEKGHTWARIRSSSSSCSRLYIMSEGGGKDSFVSQKELLQENSQDNRKIPPPNGSASQTNGSSASKDISNNEQPTEAQSTPIIPWEEDDEENVDNDIRMMDETALAPQQPKGTEPPRHMDLMWCNTDVCKDTIRERVDSQGHIVLTGPATGQVAYAWEEQTKRSASNSPAVATARVLLLIKPHDDELLHIAAQAVREWVAPANSTIQTNNTTSNGSFSSSTTQQEHSYSPIQVMLDPSVAARLEHYYDVPSDQILLFENASDSPFPDLICTLGGDGLLMHAGMLFQGPSPPMLSIAGGSLGFLTPFETHEMISAVRVALGLNNNVMDAAEQSSASTSSSSSLPLSEQDSVYPPNMPSYPYAPLLQSTFTTPTDTGQKLAFGALGEGRLCLSIRMRLSCRILNSQGVCRAQYNILNEVVIDRGSSPYLAALECFCDNHHMSE